MKTHKKISREHPIHNYCPRSKRHFHFLLFGLCFALFLSTANAQVATSPQNDKRTSYISEIDQELTLRKILILPTLDNVDGIYARPFENALHDIVGNDHQLDLVDSKTVGPALSPYDLEDDPARVQTLTKSSNADALIASKITKGPEGLSIQMSLFAGFDGLLLATETKEKIKSFDLKTLSTNAEEVIKTLKSKIPYRGLVLSRNGQRVTLNLGKKDGIDTNQVLTAVQIIKLTRHPKFHFIVSSDKEILGKIKLKKVDETLSFGEIISEKERGVIEKYSKIAGVDFVNYEDTSLPTSTTNNVDNKKNFFGDNPKEWTPVPTAQFGLVNFSLGMGSFTMNSNLTGGTSEVSMSANKSLYLGLILHGELWVNANWSVESDIRQGILTANNPRTSSSPSELNYMTSYYVVNGAYSFLIKDYFWGPKIQVLFGFRQTSLTADYSSPVAFTSMTYRGLDLGLRGVFPLDPEEKWRLGAQFNIVPMPSLSETPLSSGASSSNTVNVYSAFANRRIGQRMMATAKLEFEYYQSTFSGLGGRAPERATTTSQRITTLYGGLSWMF